MTATGTEKVWDLADSSAQHRQRRRGPHLAGPVAAALAIVAVCAAVAPGVPLVARWCLVVSFGGTGALIGFSSLRHRQTLAALLVGVAGLALPVAAVALAASVTASTTPPVVSRTVPEAALGRNAPVLATTPAFADLPGRQRADTSSFVAGVVARLRLLHGATGPFPAALAWSEGSIVEQSGLLRGTSLGRLPDDAHLRYSVSTSGSAFRITVVADSDSTASITADSTLVVPGAD